MVSKRLEEKRKVKVFRIRGKGGRFRWGFGKRRMRGREMG